MVGSGSAAGLMGAAVSTTAAAAADGASKSQQAGSTAVAAAQPPQQQQPAGRTAAAAAPPRPPSGQRCRVRLDLSTPDSPPLQAQPPAPAPAPLAVAAAAQPPGGVCSSELPSLHVDCMRSPVPCAATCFIANDDDADGAVACLVSSHKKQQRRRLSVAIPGGSHEDGCRNTLSAAAQSPLGTVMASLMAEAARAGHAQATTPWSAPSTSLRLLLSPRGSAPDSGLLLATPCFSTALAATAAAAAGASAHLLDDACAASSVCAAGELAIGQHADCALGQQHGPSMAAATSKPVRHKRTYSDFYDDGGRCAASCDAARAAAAAAMSSRGRPDACDLAALAQWQQMIEAAEQQWGSSHPAVGRAWLELARALQATDKQSEAAKHATKKAFDICQILLQQTAVESQAAELGQYLMAKFSSKAMAAKQAAAAAAQQRQLTAAATPDAQHGSPAPSGTASGAVSAMLQLQQAAAMVHQQQQLALLLQRAAGGGCADAAQLLAAAHAAMLGGRGDEAAATAAKLSDGTSPAAAAAAAAAAGSMPCWEGMVAQQLALTMGGSRQLAPGLAQQLSGQHGGPCGRGNTDG